MSLETSATVAIIANSVRLGICSFNWGISWYQVSLEQYGATSDIAYATNRAIIAASILFFVQCVCSIADLLVDKRMHALQAIALFTWTCFPIPIFWAFFAIIHATTAAVTIAVEFKYTEAQAASLRLTHHVLLVALFVVSLTLMTLTLVYDRLAYQSFISIPYVVIILIGLAQLASFVATLNHHLNEMNRVRPGFTTQKQTPIDGFIFFCTVLGTSALLLAAGLIYDVIRVVSACFCAVLYDAPIGVDLYSPVCFVIAWMALYHSWRRAPSYVQVVPAAAVVVAVAVAVAVAHAPITIVVVNAGAEACGSDDDDVSSPMVSGQARGSGHVRLVSTAPPSTSVGTE